MIGTKSITGIALVGIIALVFILNARFTGSYVYVPGSTSGLAIWSSYDPQGGSIVPFINENMTFYANFTTLGGAPIAGAGVTCDIEFNSTGFWTAPAGMTYDPGNQLYGYEGSFKYSGNHSFRVTCNGSTQGYDANLQGNDTYNVHKNEWWNATWTYRIKISLYNHGVQLDDWPVEVDLNLTEVLRQINVEGTFDDNSTRVVEYNSTGGVMHPLPSQFDKDLHHNPATNAFGTLVFMANGTTPANYNRTFFMYFDIEENGLKEQPSYPTNISYLLSGDEIHINTTSFSFYMDTNRSDNTSGLYDVRFKDYPVPFFIVDETGRTAEYSEYSNGTNNLSFDFTSGVAIIEGPLRLTVIQTGDEVLFGDLSSPTGEGMMVKKYHFYNKAGNETLGAFIHITQNYTNIAAYPVQRNSTAMGSIAFDVGRAWQGLGSSVSFYDGNSSDPGSWVMAGSDAQEVLGMVNLNETTDEFYVYNYTPYERIGVQLDSVTVDPFESIIQTALLYIGSGSTSEFIAVRDITRDMPAVTSGSYETMPMESITHTDYDVYNRNETIFIESNITYDPYSFLDTVNVSLSNGTPGAGDDIEIEVYDDGSHGDQVAGDYVYSNFFNISTTENTGLWTASTIVYDMFGVPVNQSHKNFTITKTFFVNTSVINQNGEIDREVNATVFVMNYRQDTWQEGAFVNCSVYDSTTLLYTVDQQDVNQTEPGRFFVNFTAPWYFGSFTLNCTAGKDGNDGSDISDFGAEDVETDIDITVQPENHTFVNITWITGDNITLRVNATNTQNGTAYNATVDLELPSNITANSTSYICETDEGAKQIMIGKACYVDFVINVMNTTAPSNFTLNVSVTWNNSNTIIGHNETSMNVTILPTYLMSVPQDNIITMIARGINKSLSNITIYSYGNAPLENVNFDVIGFSQAFHFSFIPSGYTQVNAGVTTEFAAYLLVDEGYSTGFFTGILNVTTSNNGYKELELNITVSGTNVSINVLPENITASNITYYDSQNFTLDFNSSNMGNNTAYNTNVTINFSSPYISTTNSTNYQCGDLQPGENCSGIFLLTVSNGTPSGLYDANVTVVWGNPEIGVMMNSSVINITVESNVNMTINETSINGTVVHGTTGVIGNFSMNSTGNDPVTGIELTIVDTYGQLQDFTVNVIPNVSATQGGNMTSGQLVYVDVEVSVPLGYPNGTYAGFLNVTSNNSGYRLLGIEVTVPETRTWDMSPLDCMHPESPEFGTVCNVTIENTGNVQIEFDIYPPATGDSNLTMNNYTWPSVTYFSIENQSSFILSIYYNVTDAPLTFYNSSYNVTGVYTVPQSRNVSILLTPFVNPLINISVSPSSLPQQNSTELVAYVLDQGGVAGINFTRVNVTRPNGTVDQIVMRYLGGTDPYIYQEFYPADPLNGTWGSTLSRGNYTVVGYAEDNLGLNQTANSSFYVYVVLVAGISTSRSNGEYYQGETGTLLFNVTELSGIPLSGVNVSIVIKDPTNHSVGMQNSEFLTNSQGEPSSYPTFELFSDSLTGTYNITVTSAFNDTPVSRICYDTSYSSFTVLETTPGVLTLDLEAPSEVSTGDGLEVYATITNGVNNIDPDWIMVSLYDSLDNAILTNQTMTYQSTGRYSRWHNTSASVNTGSWRWHVTIGKDGNVISKDVFTRLVGGLFDVRDITIVDNTIEDLQITVVIENTGDIPQDVFVLWNLTRLDTGAPLQEGLDTVRIDPLTSYVYTINPSGITYTGSARILFVASYSGTEKAAAFEDFTIQEGGEGPAPPPGGGKTKEEEAPSGGAGLGPVGAPDIEITDYPDEIPTEAGRLQYPSVTVNNTGSVSLHNVMIRIEGIPNSWYNVTPKLIPIVNPGSTGTFVINMLVPQGTEARQYYGVINATSDEAKDEKITSVIVFGSREELVRYQLQKLKEEFKEFREDVNATAAMGEKDLSRVYGLIDEIQYQIDLTEGYLDAKMYDEALEAVTTGWRLLDRARELLRDAPPLRPVTILEIPDWMITLILILIILALALVVVISRYKKKLEKVFKFRKTVTDSVAAADVLGSFGGGGAPSKVEQEAIARTRREEEKKKIEKVLSLLEREYKEGIISEKAYNELVKRNADKLKELGG